MSNIEIVEIKVAGKPKVTIGECMKDALELAASEWRNVRLCHEGAEWLINVNDLIASITRDKDQ